MRADLHIHTTNSDGTLSFEEVCIKAKEKGLDIIAIADHDVYERHSEPEGIKIINAVEVTSLYNGENIHILAYFNDEPGQVFLDFLKKVKNDRIERAKKICDLLKSEFNIDLDKSFISNANSITRGQIGREIILQGYQYSKQYIFSNMLGDGCKCYIPASSISPSEVIALIKEAKGLAVLAHPMIYKNENLMSILDLGFDGMEVIYPFTKDVYTKFRHLALKHNMFITAGSDFHSTSATDSASHGSIGEVYLSGHDLDVFLEHLKERNK